MDRILIRRKIKVDRERKLSRRERKAFGFDKRIKRPGLDNDAFFTDSASSVDVCI
jgi:hypothetical protein